MCALKQLKLAGDMGKGGREGEAGKGLGGNNRVGVYIVRGVLNVSVTIQR